MSVLLAYGPQLLSLYKTASASIGTVASGPISRLTNGVMGQRVTFVETSVAGAVDLGAAETVTFGALFNHNLDAGATLRLQGSNLANFSSLALDEPMVITSPHAWIDLSGLPGVTLQHFRFNAAGAAQPIAVGEFVVGALTTVRCYRWGYDYGHFYLERHQGASGFGRLVRTKRNIRMRTRQVTWSGPRDLHVTLSDLALYAMRFPGPVVVVPDEDDSDIWLVDWSDQHVRETERDNLFWADILLAEQSLGAV